MGDAVLQRLADVLRRSCRETDLPARFGGEEFALVLPATDEAGGQVVAERLRAAAEADAGPVRYTVSVGVAAFGPHGDDARSLLVTAESTRSTSRKW